MTEQINLALTKLDKALEGLKTIAEQEMDFYMGFRDATIQRFEYTIELYWKLLKKILLQEGVVTNAPREILKAAFQNQLIDQELSWLDMLKDRNSTSHTYDEELANNIYDRIKNIYLPLMLQNFEQLQLRLINSQN